MTKRVVILFSGEGSNFENIVQKLHNKTIDNMQIKVVGAICNKLDANGVNRAKKLGIECKIIDHKAYDSRESFDAKLVEAINDFHYDLCVLAGFMRILTPVFTDNVRAINIHPSFLPYCKGADGIKESFESGMGFGGVSIHWVSNGVDEGEIICQEKVEISPDDTLESFRKKIQAKEHEMYPEAILEVVKGIK